MKTEPPSFAPRFPSQRAFTLLELLTAVVLTAVIAASIVGLVSNMAGFWSRTSGRISAEAQARHVLEQLTLDLQSAWYRDDGGAWLEATILANTNNTLGLWNTQATTNAATKPGNAAGSLQGIAAGNLADARFGIAGTWLRFFTTKRGSNTSKTTTLSAPVAVGYQIVRRATSTSPANTDRRYLLHRVETSPANTLLAGFDLAAPTPYAPAQNNPAAARGSAAEIRFPTLESVIAENVIDFGVRLFVHRPNPASGAPELTQIFPSSAADLDHRATQPPGVADASGGYTSCFPEVIDVMVRVLTEEGARLIAGYEANPQRVTLPPGRTPQQYWWELALAHSQVFTRRVVVVTAKSI